MRNILLHVVIITSLLGAMYSCQSDEDLTPLVITLDANQYSQEVKSGQYVFFTITLRSLESPLSHISIYSKRVSEGSKEVYSESLDGSTQQSVEFEYLSPIILESSEVITLNISATNEMGQTQSITAYVTVLGADTPISEISGQTLYGANSNKTNGYSIESNLWLYVDKSMQEDTLLVDGIVVPDFYDYSDDATSETLQREWRSMSGRYFAKLSGFDYASATVESIISGYSVAEKRDRAIDLAIDDVIFIGSDVSTPLAAIKINAIFDDEGLENDRYNISMKMLDYSTATE